MFGPKAESGVKPTRVSRNLEIRSRKPRTSATKLRGFPNLPTIVVSL